MINIFSPEYVYKEGDEDQEWYKKQIRNKQIEKHGLAYYLILLDPEIPECWKDAFREREKYLIQFSKTFQDNIKEYGEFYPEEHNLFKALKLTPLSSVKVVIWGQDPYPSLLNNKKPRAQGYSFGVDKTDVIPASLKNIFKEISNEYTNFVPPPNGDLTYLAKQGILFMNMCCAYFPKMDDKKRSRYYGVWKPFSNMVIDILNNNISDCIHLLWGKQAEELYEDIASKYKFISAHPSPFSAYKFFGNNHFLKCNIALRKKGKEVINWNNEEFTKEKCTLKTAKKLG